MSISSSLYTGMSSLFALGDKIGTLGDNIANINTTGFKANEVNFEDILFQETQAGGVRLSPTGIKSDFSEGSVQSSDISTHMAISGDGFFMLHDPEDAGTTYYTRAGEFNFDPEAYLVNPAGNIVQGYAFDRQGIEGNTLGDIQLQLTTPAPTLWDPDPSPQLVSTPKASTRLTLISNLDASAQPHSGGLFDNWDGTQEEPISLSDYEHRADHNIYDSEGVRHSIAVYYDKTDENNNIFEYLITSPPEEPGTATTDGVLARGTITFDNSGYINDMTMENYQGGGWEPGTLSGDGYLAFQTPFEGADNIEFDMGTRFVNACWDHDPNTTTQYTLGSYTKTSNTDGYGESDLAGFSISRDGIIIANFENGVTSDLFRVGLADSMDPSSRFRRIGHTLYQAEPESEGSINFNIPGSSGIGSIIGGSLETSNVDMAEQFGELIFTQRAFQANSKGMIAADEMLKTLVALKR